MRSAIVKATLWAAMGGMAGKVGAADFRQNPFTFVYEGAITKNEPGGTVLGR